MKVTRIPFNGQFKINYIYGDYNRSINKTADGRHHGVDCWGIGSKNVFSASRGKVIFAGWDNTGYGNLVKIQDGEYTHYYAHLERILVGPGQNVDFTTQIGIYGATGNVTGPHLHYEVRKNGVVIDPTTLMGIPNREGIYNSYNYVVDVDVLKEINVVAQEVINGLWGNGEERVNRLTKAGYNAKQVQNKVNDMLNSNRKSVDEIAREVIAGKWGVGDERYQRLTKAGYNYNEVQARVNQLI